MKAMRLRRAVPKSPLVSSIDLPAELVEVDDAAFELVELPVADAVPLIEVTDIFPLPEAKLGEVTLAEELDVAEAEVAIVSYVVEVKEHWRTISFASI
jgi:hypothetical protein